MRDDKQRRLENWTGIQGPKNYVIEEIKSLDYAITTLTLLGEADKALRVSNGQVEDQLIEPNTQDNSD